MKDLEQEVDGPTGEKKLLKTLCVVGTPLCTVQYEPIVWGQYWVEMDLCRMHMPSVSPVRVENCAGTGDSCWDRKKKVGADGCWRECSPEPVMGVEDPWFLCTPRYGDWGLQASTEGNCSCAASQSNVLKIHSSQSPQK